MTDTAADITLENDESPIPHRARKTHSEPLILRFFQKFFEIGGHLSPSITGRIAYRLWFTPTRFKTPTSEQKALDSATIECHRINDQDIATFSWGQTGPTVLLVHGWSGRGTQMWPFVEPLLDAGYRVLSFDAPAHGKSAGKQTSLYEITDTVLALQDIYGEFDSAITHSFGGPCTALASLRGLKTKRIVSICPPATTLGLVEKFARTLHLTDSTKADLIRRIEKTFGEDIWEDICMRNTVKEIITPGMVIHDAHDTDIPWEEGQAVAHAWNDAPFIITSGLGHRRILRDDTVISSTLKFIKG